MLYGLETVSLRKRQESELEVAELKMLQFSLGVTRLDRIRNEYIRGTAHVGRLEDKVREARLRWFGPVQRREMLLLITHHYLKIRGSIWVTVVGVDRYVARTGITGAPPGVGAHRRAPGGRIFACGTRPGTAERRRPTFP
ncbi:hypothetical protein QTP86_018964 [Hemibagrus guttatus]|nr:hypothetical protein QTP86_018964 [Hemibagrus guttatus]